MDRQCNNRKKKDKWTTTIKKNCIENWKLGWARIVSASLVAPVVLLSFKSRRQVTTKRNEEHIWSCVTQIYRNNHPWWWPQSVQSNDVNLTRWNPWFSSFLVSSNPQSGKWWQSTQAQEYCINWEIYTPHVCAAKMLLNINGKFVMGKL